MNKKIYIPYNMCTSTETGCRGREESWLLHAMAPRPTAVVWPLKKEAEGTSDRRTSEMRHDNHLIRQILTDPNFCPITLHASQSTFNFPQFELWAVVQ